MDTFDFAPRRAIVTASDSGIGQATALALADAGMDVGITWHSDEEGAERGDDEGLPESVHGEHPAARPGGCPESRSPAQRSIS